VATVTVLAAAHIKVRSVEQRLSEAGYDVAVAVGTVRVSRHGRWDAVDVTMASVGDLPDLIVDPAKRLLGLRPREAITCAFEGAAGTSDAWPTVVDIAKAVAAVVPLAVLDDHTGTTFLVHPGRGLIGPEEYRTRRSTFGGDLLRRLLDGS
jgi:hypothetical protein